MLQEGRRGIPSAGTKYEQQGEWVGFPYHNIINVTEGLQNGQRRHILFDSDSIITDGLEYHATYQFVKASPQEGGGAIFIVTAVSTSFGITEPQMIDWHNFALANYLNLFGGNGEILWNYSKEVGTPTIPEKLTLYRLIIWKYFGDLVRF